MMMDVYNPEVIVPIIRDKNVRGDMILQYQVYVKT